MCVNLFGNLLGYLIGNLILLFRFRHFQATHPAVGRIETVVSMFQICNMEITQRAQGVRHGTHGCFPRFSVKFPGTNRQKKTGGAWQNQAIHRRFSVCSSLQYSTGRTGLSKGQNKVLSGLFDENPGKLHCNQPAPVKSVNGCSRTRKRPAPRQRSSPLKMGVRVRR